LDRAIALNPTHTAAWKNLGNIFQRQNKLDEAIHCYRNSITSNPTYLRAFVHLAQALSSNGEAEEARQHLERLLKIDPSNPEARALIDQYLTHHQLPSSRTP
jgi:cytochrome c-type biogenesis protein CcmH/NrfG